MHSASHRGHVHCLRLLLEQGGDPEAREEQHRDFGFNLRIEDLALENRVAEIEQLVESFRSDEKLVKMEL